MIRTFLRIGVLSCLGLAACDADENDKEIEGPSAASAGDEGAEAGMSATANGEDNTGQEGDACVPDRDVFDEEIQPLLDRRCGVCHGASPQFGAPFSVLDYEGLLEGDKMGRRKVDRIFARVAEGSMPPPGHIRPPVAEFDALMEWASCGEASPEYPTSLDATREVLAAPADLPKDVEELTLTADEFEVPELPEAYKSFVFEQVVDREMFVRRFDVIVDETAVIHHITLHYGDTDRYLYAWAPGTGPMQFPSGGLRVKPQDSFRVEIHYNNGLGLTGVKDSSGVVLYLSEPEGTEYAMLDPTTYDIMVPPRAEATARAVCEAGNDFHIFAGLPHMHEIGASLVHEVERDNGDVETIIELEGWSFDLQYFYEMGVDIYAGDTLRLTCNYRNDKERPVVGGLGTGDEMCYDFIYVTPADAVLNCPQTVMPANADLFLP